jgi:Predicted P-loop-containing kinase
MELLILTGMSGAGKSQAVNALEDIGFYCVDNVPPELLIRFAALGLESKGKIGRIALVVDTRSRGLFADFLSHLDELHHAQIPFKMLFLDCGDEVIARRYKETRRRHPLQANSGVPITQAILEEREMLQQAWQNADFVIDTTLMQSSQLKQRVREMFAREQDGALLITCMSFGFKHGIPHDADLVFDVRCLPNPFYVDELREKTGLDADVSGYVMRQEQSQKLADHLRGLLDYLIPLYIQEGKSQLVIAFGCTGGKHRSVTFAELFAQYLQRPNLDISRVHRDAAR